MNHCASTFTHGPAEKRLMDHYYGTGTVAKNPSDKAHIQCSIELIKIKINTGKCTDLKRARKTIEQLEASL